MGECRIDNYIWMVGIPTEQSEQYDSEQYTKFSEAVIFWDEEAGVNQTD